VMVLYAGFIVCWPGGRSGGRSGVRLRMIKFLAGGWVLILLLNILRCTALALISLHKPESVDFYHHYLFTFLIYGVIFWLWYLFTQSPVLPSKRVVHATTGE
jgi:exosortase/archaeosortase family protein